MAIRRQLAVYGISRPCGVKKNAKAFRKQTKNKKKQAKKTAMKMKKLKQKQKRK